MDKVIPYVLRLAEVEESKSTSFSPNRSLRGRCRLMLVKPEK